MESWQDDERIMEDDTEPDRDEMTKHLQQVRAYDHWQPFDQGKRNRKLQEIVEDEESETLDELKSRMIEFERVDLEGSEA